MTATPLELTPGTQRILARLHKDLVAWKRRERDERQFGTPDGVQTAQERAAKVTAEINQLTIYAQPKN